LHFDSCRWHPENELIEVKIIFLIYKIYPNFPADGLELVVLGDDAGPGCEAYAHQGEKRSGIAEQQLPGDLAPQVGGQGVRDPAEDRVDDDPACLLRHLLHQREPSDGLSGGLRLHHTATRVRTNLGLLDLTNEDSTIFEQPKGCKTN